MSIQSVDPTRSVVAPTASDVNVDARIDAMPRIPLSLAGGAGLLLCYLFANYDISVFALVVPSMLTNFDMSVTDLGIPIFWNLAGYGIGAYFFGHVADRYGRQRGLFMTIVVLTVGGLLSGFAWNLASFTVFRFIAGAGMGAVLAVCSAYIGELAPSSMRGKYLAKIYTLQASIALVISLASLWILDATSVGWRILLFIGCGVVFALFVLNDRAMVESPRWLVHHGQYERAEKVLQKLEKRAWRGRVPRVPAADVQMAPADADGAGTTDTAHSAPACSENPLRTLTRTPYNARLTMILVFWLVYYLASYGFLSYTTVILEGLGISQEESLLVTVLGRAAAVVVPLAMIVLIEKVERRTLMIQGTVMIAAGLLTLLLPLGSLGGVIGVFLVTMGIGWAVTPGYIYTVEIFPIQSRGTAAAIADGVGHLGGAVAPFIVLPVLTGAGAVPAVWMLIGTALFSGVVVRMGPKTRGRSLSDISGS